MEENGVKKSAFSKHLTRHRSAQSWKRLHWCISKVNSAQQVTSLMAMFSLIATVELPLPLEEKETHPNLVVAFVATSSLLVAVTVLVKVIYAFILPHLDSIAELNVKESDSSPHDQLTNWIFWACLLGTCVSPILFCLDLILISWIKFPKYAKEAPMAATAILVPMIVVIILFGCILYYQMHRFELADFYRLPLPSRRYSEIAEDWELDSTTLSSGDEESHLLNSHCSVTSYGAICQKEFIGSPNLIFADIFWH